MKAKFPIQKRLNKTLIVALTLMLGVIGLLLYSSHSYAQQEPNRQLVQNGSSNAINAKRIALVIGNGAYTKAPPLRNPPNDARDMAATLRTLGFDVTSGINVNQRDMKRLVREFGQKLKAGGSGLFYYAGHGVQSKGRNYLIPVDADIQSEAEVEDSGVDASLVLNFMDDAQNGLNIVILDACRNNPFSRSFRSASEGLAQVDAPTGTLIAYATAPGRVASDGTGQNGLYTSELLKQMRVPGLSATEMFMRVRAEVMKQTANKQVPWEASSLVGAFYFRGSPSLSNSGANNTAPPETPVTSVAAEYIKSGDQLVGEKKWSEAEVEYRLAVRLDPGNAQWHSKLGFALFSGGKYSEAEAEYRVAIRLDPNNAGSHYSLAQTFNEGEKKYPEAETEAREAIRLVPNGSGYHNYLGWILNEEQRYAEGEAEANEAIRLDPKAAWYHVTLGWNLLAENKESAAEIAFREAIKLDPNVGGFHLGLGSVFLKQKKFAEAESEVKEGLRLDPKNADLHYSLAQALNEEGKKYPEAEAEAREAIRLAPNASGYHNYLGWILSEEQRNPEGEAEAREAIRLDPKASWYYHTLGWILLPQNKDAAAETAFREAIRLKSGTLSSSDESSFHRGLGTALQRQKKFAEAEAEYGEAIRLDPTNALLRTELDNLQREKAEADRPAAAQRQADEIARRPVTFKGSYGAWTFFSNGTLTVSPGKVSFLCERGNFCKAGVTVNIECSEFASAVVDGSAIRHMRGKQEYRFNAASPADAARALEAIREVCKVTP